MNHHRSEYMATGVYIKRTAIDLLRSRTYSTKSAYVAIGVLYSFGHSYLAAQFTHDYECHQAFLSGNAIHLPPGNWPDKLADTQRLIDQVVDDMEAALPQQPHQSPKPKLRLVEPPDTDRTEGIPR
jgi:hypothetical protein